MFSRGALNGNVLNAHPVASGAFVEEMDAAGTLAVAGSAQAARRGVAGGAGFMTIAGDGGFSLRAALKAVGTIAPTGQAGLLRRAVGSADSTVMVAGDATFNRRAVAAGVDEIRIDGAATVIHRFLRQAPIERTAQLTFGNRAIRVRPELRSMSVQHDARRAAVPSDRRSA